MQISLHLLDGIGMTGENLTMLAKVGQFIFMFGGPFVISGDLNKPPELIPEPWLRAIKGKIMKPEYPTCKSTGEWRTLDYHIVSDCIEAKLLPHYVQSSIRTHLPVAIAIDRQCRKQLIRIIKQPKSFPKPGEQQEGAKTHCKN